MRVATFIPIIVCKRALGKENIIGECYSLLTMNYGYSFKYKPSCSSPSVAEQPGKRKRQKHTVGTMRQKLSLFSIRSGPLQPSLKG